MRRLSEQPTRRRLLSGVAGAAAVAAAGCAGRRGRGDDVPEGTPVAVASLDGRPDAAQPVGFTAPEAFCRYPTRRVEIVGVDDGTVTDELTATDAATTTDAATATTSETDEPGGTLTDAGATDTTETTTDAVAESPTATLDLTCLARGNGRFELSGGAVARGQWTAPATDRYTVSAVYDGHGQCRYDAADTANVVASLTSGVVVRPADSQRVLAQETTQDAGTVPDDPVTEGVQDAVRFALDQVDPDELGPFARWVGRQSARLAEGVLGAELVGPAEDGFPAAETDVQTITTRFDAEGGSTYTFEYAPRALLVGEIDTDERFRASAQATYEPRGFRVQRQ